MLQTRVTVARVAYWGAAVRHRHSPRSASCATTRSHLTPFTHGRGCSLRVRFASVGARSHRASRAP